MLKRLLTIKKSRHDAPAVLVAAALLGGAMVLGMGVVRENERVNTLAEAVSLYRSAAAIMNDRFAPTARAGLFAREHTLSFITVRRIAALEPGNDVWRWSRETATAARRVALAASRLASAAANVIPDTAATMDLLIDAEILAANSVRIGHSIDEAESASALDKDAEKHAMAAQCHTVHDKACSGRASQTDAPPPRTKAFKEDRLANEREWIPASSQRRLVFLVSQAREQHAVSRQVLKEANAIEAQGLTTGNSVFARALVGEVTSSIVRTLVIAGAVTLLILAITVPATSFLTRHHIVGGHDLTDVKVWNYAPLALAAVPLLAAPFLVSAAATGSFDGANGSGGSSWHRSTVTNAPVSNYTDMRTPLPETSSDAIVGALDRFTTVEESAHSQFRAALVDDRIVREQLMSTSIALNQSVVRLAESDSVFHHSLVTTAHSEDLSTRNLALLAKIAIEEQDGVRIGLAALTRQTERLSEHTQALQGSTSGLMAASWMDQCLRLKESRRAAPMRALSWMFGNAGQGDVTRTIPSLEGNELLNVANRACDEARETARP
jgi:hypothetical protein